MKKKNRKKKNKRIFIIAVIFSIILIGIIVYLFAFRIPQVQISSNFVKPQWARLECAPTDAYEGSIIKWLDQQSLFRCNAYTESCRFKMTNTRQSIIPIRGEYRICDLNGESCSSRISYSIESNDESEWFEITVGKSVKFDTGILVLGEDSNKITIVWKPWKLYRFVGGAKWIVNSYNCDITSGSKSNIRLEDYPSVGKLFRQGGEGTKWINYVNDWNYGPPTNVFTHTTHGEVYCTAGQIFDIIELQMKDGSLKKLDPAYSSTLPDGEYLSGLGTKLANVECCPNEPSCDDDFGYVEEPPEKECFTDIQCFNAGGPVPVDGTHYVLYQCFENKCIKSQPIEVECTTSAQCADGEICDLSTMNYGKCIKQIPGEICGDGICDITESFKTCPADCTEEIECKWFQDYYEKERCGFNPGCWFGITEPTFERGCKTSSWVIFVILGLTVTIIIIAIILVRSRRRVRRVRSNNFWK